MMTNDDIRGVIEKRKKEIADACGITRGAVTQ
jgi:hypothetical protein